MNKKIKIILFIYLIQTLISACNPCECHPAKTFERNYTDINVRAWDTAGFQNSEVTDADTAYRNAFGLTISVLFDLNEITKSRSNLNFSAFGFSAAYACSCVGNEYINTDPINSIEILLTDVETNEVTDVTNNFRMNYNGNQITLSELFNVRESQHHGFQVDLTQYNDIPNTVLFTINVTLESGVVLTKNTAQIHFEN